MFKGLISRVFRSGALKNLTAAYERKPPAAVPLPKASHIANQRNEFTPDRVDSTVSEDLLDGIAALQQRYHKDMEYYRKTASAQADQDPSNDDATTHIEHLDVSAHIECIRRATGYTFKDADLVRGAIFRGEKRYKGKELSRSTQYQLAKLGDELFKSIHHSTNFPAATASDEFRGRAWTWLVSNDTLHFAAEQLGLPEMLAESGHARLIARDGTKGFGTMVEAIVGAVYLDSGENGAVTRRTMARLLGTSMKRTELADFHEKYWCEVGKPGRRLRWHRMRAEKKAHAQGQREDVGELFSLDGDVEKRLLDWTKEVQKLKRASMRVPVDRRTLRKTLRRTLRDKARRGTLWGPGLQQKINQLKKQHKRTLKTTKNKAETPKKAKIMLEWIQQAEEHLRQGKEFHTCKAA